MKNRVILAAAGSRKTQRVVEAALAVDSGRVLVVTYTRENQREIERRFQELVGGVPPRITVEGWFSFLISQCAKPYQRAVFGEPLTIRGLNFEGRRSRFTLKSNHRYFMDANRDLFRDGVADLVVTLNHATGGAVVRRLERVFSHIFVDEVQDLGGFDLDVMELLFESAIQVVLVGDPRQHTLATNIGPRNKKYRGVKLVNWFAARSGMCLTEEHTDCYRCNQVICDFADALFPGLPATRSVSVPRTSHDGVFVVSAPDVHCYVERFQPVTVLRDSRRADTLGLAAMNIGVAKGRTFDRVLIFPTNPMVKYLAGADQSILRAPERLYVAVTRARYSAAFVVPIQRSASTRQIVRATWWHQE